MNPEAYCPICRRTVSESDHTVAPVRDKRTGAIIGARVVRCGAATVADGDQVVRASVGIDEATIRVREEPNTITTSTVRIKPLSTDNWLTYEDVVRDDRDDWLRTTPYMGWDWGRIAGKVAEKLDADLWVGTGGGMMGGPTRPAERECPMCRRRAREMAHGDDDRVTTPRRRRIRLTR